MMVLKIQSLKASMKEPVRRQKMAVASRPVRRDRVARQHENILATSRHLQLRKLGDEPDEQSSSKYYIPNVVSPEEVHFIV